MILCCLKSPLLSALFMRPSSLGGGRVLRRTLSVCPSVCPSVPLSLPSVTSRHLANYNVTHVLFGTHRGPHIVRPSRPHKLVLYKFVTHDTTNLFLFVLFCVLPVSYDVRLSNLNKHYLLTNLPTYLLTYLLTYIIWLSYPKGWP